MLLRGDRPWTLLRADDVRGPRICFVFSTIHTLNCLGLCAATQANANDPRDVRCAHATSVTRRMSLTDRHSRSNILHTSRVNESNMVHSWLGRRLDGRRLGRWLGRRRLGRRRADWRRLGWWLRRRLVGGGSNLDGRRLDRRTLDGRQLERRLGRRLGGDATGGVSTPSSL